MEEQDLNESSTNDDDDELMMINNNQTVIRSRNGSFTSRTFTSRTNGPLASRTNGPINSRTNGSLTSCTNGPLASRTNGPINSRTNGSLTSRTNGPITSRTNGSVVLERGVRGKVITINRAKHYGFLKRNDNVESRDIFAREASIVNETRQQKFFISDNCKFDVIRTPRGMEAVNISIEERHINSIAKLPKIPKKQETNIQSQVSADLFKSTIAELFKEALRKR